MRRRPCANYPRHFSSTFGRTYCRMPLFCVLRTYLRSSLFSVGRHAKEHKNLVFHRKASIYRYFPYISTASRSKTHRILMVARMAFWRSKRPFSTKAEWLKNIDNSATFSNLLSATSQQSRRASYVETYRQVEAFQDGISSIDKPRPSLE